MSEPTADRAPATSPAGAQPILYRCCEHCDPSYVGGAPHHETPCDLCGQEANDA